MRRVLATLLLALLPGLVRAQAPAAATASAPALQSAQSTPSTPSTPSTSSKSSTSPDPSAPADCPAAHDVAPLQLVGAWHAEVEGQGAGAALHLHQHPRYAGSLAGELDRAGARARVAADLDDGELTLEESADGVHIAATWLGDVVEGSCGREIRGSWEPAGGAPRAFVLRRADH